MALCPAPCTRNHKLSCRTLLPPREFTAGCKDATICLPPNGCGRPPTLCPANPVRPPSHAHSKGATASGRSAAAGKHASRRVEERFDPPATASPSAAVPPDHKFPKSRPASSAKRHVPLAEEKFPVPPHTENDEGISQADCGLNLGIQSEMALEPHFQTLSLLLGSIPGDSAPCSMAPVLLRARFGRRRCCPSSCSTVRRSFNAKSAATIQQPSTRKSSPNYLHRDVDLPAPAWSFTGYTTLAMTWQRTTSHTTCRKLGAARRTLLRQIQRPKVPP